jgi:tRNA(Ile)-lysidine synthase
VTSRPGPLPAGLDRTALVAAVAEGLRTLPEGAGVVVALSGGPDSTSLAYLTAEARPDLELTLVHVRHGLRDDRDDVAVVERHASFLGLPLEVVPVTVTGRATGRRPPRGTRGTRPCTRSRPASRRRACWWGTTPTTRPRPSCSVPRGGPVSTGSPRWRRPVTGSSGRCCAIRRADLRRFVALEGLPVAEDPTNLDPTVRRIAVRTRVLPALREVAPTRSVPSVGWRRWPPTTRPPSTRWPRPRSTTAAVVTGDVVSVPDAALDRLPPAIARRVWRQVLVDRDRGRAAPTSAVVAGIEALAPGRRLHLGDVEVTAGGGWRAVAPRRCPHPRCRSPCPG